MIKVSNPFANIPPLFSDLAKSLAGEIDCSQSKLEEYAKDNSPYSIKPQAIIYPKNGTDIKHALSFAREYTIPITVRGNGKGSQGGALGEGVLLDMTRYFTHIRQINMLEHTITVDAGVTVKELREKLHGWKMDIPVLTAQDDTSTVGALISTKGVTPTSFHFGTIREWVEALTVVVDTGEEHRIADGITPSGRLLGIYQSVFPILSEDGPMIRAVKPETSDDATGYCIWNTSIGPRQLIDQIVGGEGTLGIITTVTLRLVPYKQFTKTICIPLTDKTLLGSCIQISKHHKAEHMFLYDSTFMELVDRYHLHAAPSFPAASYTLAVTFYGNSKEELHMLVETYKRALPINAQELFEYSDKQFIERISNPTFLASLLHSYTQGSHTPISTCDGIIVPQAQYTKILEELENYLYSTGRLYAITGNAGSSHLTITTLFDDLSPHYEQDLSIYTQTIFSFVKKYKGGISAYGGDGIAKAPFIPFIYSEQTVAIFSKIKSAWDPLLILNPGKKINTTLTYLQNHLSRRDTR
jgi:FAD/FMN-containing dehydrogenase